MRRLRVLLVEDEQAIADNVIFALRYAGYDVHHCTLVSDAMHWLETHSPDFVVLDVGLPDGNGFDLCKTIRAQSDVPVLFLTARSEEIDRVVGFEIGADDYVVKPFSPRELTARINAILKRSGASRASNSVFELHEPSRSIRYHGEVLDLTFYEYGILQHLLSHPGQVFSREQLLNVAWREPQNALDRVIDTHIKTLRAKLNNVNPADVIVTHRSVGYSLQL